MSYYVENVLKLSFSEWKNFEQFVDDYVRDHMDDASHFISRDIIENGDLIDFLFDYKLMDTNCMCIKGFYNAKSMAYHILDEYRYMIGNDENKEDEYSYMEIGESVCEYFDWSGNLDEPYAECYINPNLSGNEQDIDGKLRIIID